MNRCRCRSRRRRIAHYDKCARPTVFNPFPNQGASRGYHFPDESPADVLHVSRDCQAHPAARSVHPVRSIRLVSSEAHSASSGSLVPHAASTGRCWNALLPTDSSRNRVRRVSITLGGWNWLLENGGAGVFLSSEELLELSGPWTGDLSSLLMVN